MHFISKDEFPKGKFATYARIVFKICPQKAEIHRTQLTVGGQLVKYPHTVSTPMLDISTVKCLRNSVIYTLDAKFFGNDIKYFYLNTTMDTIEYMRIKAPLIPEEIIQQ